jgi:hypothetical protein
MVKSTPVVARDRGVLKNPRRALGDLKAHASKYATPSVSTRYLSRYDSTLSHSHPIQFGQSPRSIHTRFWPSTPTVAPLSGHSTQATRSRGYEEGAYVTILKPGAVSSPVKRMMTRNKADKRVSMRVLDEEESGTTTWPQPD